MSRPRAYLIAVCALLLVLAPATAVLARSDGFSREASVASRAAETGGVVRQASAGVVRRTSDGVVRQGYDLLLDRFVAPLRPASILGAAAEAVTGRAAEAKGGEYPPFSAAEAADREEAWGAYAAWFDVIVARAAPEADRRALELAALKGMASGVGEHHTKYLTVAQYEQHLAWRRGDIHYVGIGARLRAPHATVVEVYDDSPAERAGLRAGDAVLEIDGVAVSGSPRDALTERLRGAAGETVELLVDRHGLARPMRLVVVREEIRLDFVRSRTMSGPDGSMIGYVRVRGFPRPEVDEDVGRALSELETAGIDGLVLDLRGNPGGRLDVGIRMTSRFVRDGALLQQVNRDGRQRTIRPSGEPWPARVPIVILVDAGTASMGEIFSAALQEAGVARVVGSRTHGSVAGAQVMPLADGSAMQVTVLQITTGRGVVLNDVGVVPDEVVEPTDDELRVGLDVQLEAGLRYLRAAATRARPAAFVHEWRRAA